MAHAPVPDREPPLEWRRPAPLWALLALIVGLGLPTVLLWGEGGMAQIAIFVVALGFLAALISISIADAMGRPPHSRREVMLHALWLGALAALSAPFGFQLLLHAMEGVDAPNGPTGLPLTLPFALAPLALFLGLPMALFSGLVLAFIAFRRGETKPPVMTLTPEDEAPLPTLKQR